MSKHVRLSIPDEVRLYAFQLKKELKLGNVQQAYYLILSVGMKALQKQIKRSYLPSDGRGRRPDNIDLYTFTIPVARYLNEKP